MRYAEEQLAPAHTLRMNEDRLEAEHRREQGRAAGTSSSCSDGPGHEQALQGRQQVELQQIEVEKIRFYQYYLQQGGVAAWAFHLSRHPEDSRLVMENLRQDQLVLIQSQMELATEIIKGDAAEEYELEEPKRVALRTLQEFLNQRLPGVANGPALASPRRRRPHMCHRRIPRAYRPARVVTGSPCLPRASVWRVPAERPAQRRARWTKKPTTRTGPTTPCRHSTDPRREFLPS